jgi:hypothetical protein
LSAPGRGCWPVPANQRSNTATGINILTCAFYELGRSKGTIIYRPTQPPNRDFAPRLEHGRRQKEEGTTMNKFGFAAVAASGLTAAILGLAAPAQAAMAVNTPISVASAINIPTDFGHHAWVVDIQPQVNAPHR